MMRWLWKKYACSLLPPRISRKLMNCRQELLRRDCYLEMDATSKHRPVHWDLALFLALRRERMDGPRRCSFICSESSEDEQTRHRE
jgi:hypothetical protein